MSNEQTGDSVREEFIEKIAMMAQADGLPRIAGRIFALLVYDGDPVAFGALADELKVSRGSVSQSVRLLEERLVVKRISRPGERQDYFQVADDVFVTLLRSEAGKAQRAKAEIDATIRRLPEDATGPRARLRNYSEFYSAVSEAVRIAEQRLIASRLHD